MKRLFAVITALLIAFPLTAFAIVDDNLQGEPADSLTITVGYFGGPYYEKAVFTVEELWALDVQNVEYTAIDNMPAVIIEHAAGVTLADLMDASGIDIGSVQTFNFWTKDKTTDYYNSLTKTFLIDTPRFCYYSLPDNWDKDEQAANEFATLDAVRVPTMIALADDWQRVIAGATFGSGFDNLTETKRFRLVYGQTDVISRTASDSAKWIHRIEVTLGGAPTITLDTDITDAVVGSVFRTEATVQAADPTIAENLKIEWKSEDENIATVDENGVITVHREGSVIITATIGGSTATILVNGTPGETIIADPSGDTPIDNPGSEVAPNNSGQTIIDNQGEGTGELEELEISEQTDENTAPVEPSELPVVPITIAETEIVTIPKGTITAREFSIIAPAKVQSQSQNGGVQNWRTDEMADSAVELPIIPEENAMLPVMFVGTIAMFAIGGCIEFITFKKQVGGQ
jgi:hypothetical protein